MIIAADCQQTDWRVQQPSHLACVLEELSVEDLQTLPAAQQPRASRYRSDVRERRGKRNRSMIILERTREGHRNQTNNGIKDNVGKFLRVGMERIIYGLFQAHSYHLELNCIDIEYPVNKLGISERPAAKYKSLRHRLSLIYCSRPTLSRLKNTKGGKNV